MPSTRRRSLAAVAACGLALAGSALVPAAPAAAEPAQFLPDADIYCQSTDGWTHATSFVARPPGTSLWIDGSAFGGHYTILEETHYIVPGELLDDPVDDPGSLQLVSPTLTFGKKASGLPTVSCQVVSRWRTPDGDYTIIAPMTLVRVSG